MTTDIQNKPIPQGYKLTEVGIIPEDWDVKTLGEVGEVIIGLTYSPSNVKNIHFVQADLMADCSHLHNSSTSISSLHAIEHFGLGRYGDPVRPDGHLLGLDNIYRILRNEGKFYFSVPIGPQRVEFNAHRVFSLQYLLNSI